MATTLMNSDCSMLSCLSDEDKLLIRKAEDLIYSVDKNYKERYSFFLDERQSELIRQYFTSVSFDRYMFYGGYDSASRKILGIFPDFFETDNMTFPVSCILFEYRTQDSLSHRDFLGSLMSLQIKRKLVGDIIVNSGKSYVFVHQSAADFIICNTEKIGRNGVKCCICDSPEFDDSRKFTEISGTVASLRLDCIVSLVSGMSREKSTAFIKTSGVDINYVNIRDNSYLLKLSDIFSMRGYGKYVVSDIGNISKKGRLHISINKFI